MTDSDPEHPFSFLVGHARHPHIATGTTVITASSRFAAAVDIRGGAPGSRELAVLNPSGLVKCVDAVVLSGGSAFGLAAADAVSTQLAAQGRGFQTQDAVVPIVPCAILYDLWSHDSAQARPDYAELGARAYQSCCADFASQIGCIGAGTGAKAGAHRGGIGVAQTTVRTPVPAQITSLVAVNSFGNVYPPSEQSLCDNIPFAFAELTPEDGVSWPSPATPHPHQRYVAQLPSFLASAVVAPLTQTTLVAVMISAPLCQTDLQRIAIMAQTGLTRAIIPAHTPFDGDLVFALAPSRAESRAGEIVLNLGVHAATTTARAIVKAVYFAQEDSRVASAEGDMGGSSASRANCVRSNH